jgi:hypothetical protein
MFGKMPPFAPRPSFDAGGATGRNVAQQYSVSTKADSEINCCK